jgi:hypothetical protein
MITMRSAGKFVMIGMLACLCLSPILQAQDYTPYALGIIGKANDITADKNGNLHIIWVDNSNVLHYAKIVSNRVASQVNVATIAAAEAYYGRPRVAVRNDGQTVHIVWGKTTLSHAWRDASGSWHTETVRTAVTNREFLMAVPAVTQDEAVHVLFQYWSATTEATPMIYIRKPNGGTWTANMSIGSSASAEYRDPSIFVDSYGGLHASWRGLLTTPSASYRYAPAGSNLENATTLFIPMASDVSHNAFGDLFVDENGGVHRPIATWTRRSTVSIDYSYKSLNGSFTTPTRPSVDDLITKLDSNPAVAVAPSGQVFVSYRDLVGGNVVTYLSILNDGTWTKYIIDPAGGTTYNQHYKTALTATSKGVYGLWRASTGEIMLGVGTASTPSASVTVTSPNGMETWPSGSSRSITWTTDGVTGSVDIHLFRNFAQVGVIAQGVAASAGTYAWNVGEMASGLAPDGQGYKIRVRTDGGSYQDLSNCAFTIGAAADPTVEVTSPNGGESLAVGASRTITWSAANCDGNINIYLDQNSSLVGTIASGVTASAGSYTWTVGDYSGGTAGTGTGYKVRIETTDGSAKDSSDGAFAIVAQTDPLDLSAPDGGEAWIIGSTQRISWTSNGVTGNVNLYLYRGTTNLGLVASGISVDAGGYSWKAGYLKSGAKAPVATNYRMSIVSAVNKNNKATSASYFGLVKPKIGVKTPANGTVWKIGSSQQITWTISYVTGTVDILLYKSGVLKGTIAAGVPVTNLSYTWNVGKLLSGSAVKGIGYSICVKNSAAKGWSSGTFTLKL